MAEFVRDIGKSIAQCRTSRRGNKPPAALLGKALQHRGALCVVVIRLPLPTCRLHKYLRPSPERAFDSLVGRRIAEVSMPSDKINDRLSLSRDDLPALSLHRQSHRSNVVMPFGVHAKSHRCQIPSSRKVLHLLNLRIESVNCGDIFWSRNRSRKRMAAERARESRPPCCPKCPARQPKQRRLVNAEARNHLSSVLPFRLRRIVKSESRRPGTYCPPCP